MAFDFTILSISAECPMVPTIISASVIVVVVVSAPHTLLMSEARLFAAIDTPLQSLASTYIDILPLPFSFRSPDLKLTKRSVASDDVGASNKIKVEIIVTMCFMMVDFLQK